jgi:hypothetical protein
MQNPWLDLPAFPPFIVPVDADLLTLHGRFPPGRCELKLDLLPQPWTGNVNTAEVFMLALNPGFSPDDYLEVRNPD